MPAWQASGLTGAARCLCQFGLKVSRCQASRHSRGLEKADKDVSAPPLGSPAGSEGNDAPLQRDVMLCHRPDGSPWLLGTGSSGKACDNWLPSHRLPLCLTHTCWLLYVCLQRQYARLQDPNLDLLPALGGAVRKQRIWAATC